METNEKLHKAKSNKNDEFYTRLEDIELEILNGGYDLKEFKGKTVLLPCDDPEESNFTKFFAQNFQLLGLKKLISTSFAGAEALGEDPTLFDEGEPYEPNKRLTHGKIFVLEKDKNDDGVIDWHDLRCRYLDGNGDFNSAEVKKFRDEADFIVTNPPFSVFRKFFKWIMDADKKFIVICNKNCVTFKEVFPFIKENRVWSGARPWAGGMWFKTMDENDVDRIDNGVNMKNTPSIWLTNLDHTKRHYPFVLQTMEYHKKHSHPGDKKWKVAYKKYDDCDAIEIPYTDMIPSDYGGIMGVPISFLEKYNPEIFEIIWMDDLNQNEWRGRGPAIENANKYRRIMIRKK